MVARVNGEERSRGELARHATLLGGDRRAGRAEHAAAPGDMLGSGTVGTGCILEHGDGRWLQRGDVVELEVEGIGVLRNRSTGWQKSRSSAPGYGLARPRGRWRAPGRDVVVYEQFGSVTTRGSSHGRSRIFRLAYPEVEWVELAKEALEGWRELEEEAGAGAPRLNGLLELVETAAQSSADALDGRRSRVRAARRRKQRASRWPVGVPDGWTVLFQPEAGIVRADLAHRASSRPLRDGARLEEETRVESLDELDAKAVVVTAGPWVAELLPGPAGPRPRARRSPTSAAKARRCRRSCSWIRDARATLIYSLHDPLHGLKAGVHQGGARGRPGRAVEPDPALVERVAEWIARTYPDADPDPIGAETCMYTTTRTSTSSSSAAVRS